MATFLGPHCSFLYSIKSQRVPYVALCEIKFRSLRRGDESENFPYSAVKSFVFVFICDFFFTFYSSQIFFLAKLFLKISSKMFFFTFIFFIDYRKIFKRKRFSWLLANAWAGKMAFLICLVSTCGDVGCRCATRSVYCTCLCRSCCCSWRCSTPFQNIAPCRLGRSPFAGRWNIARVTFLGSRVSVISCCTFCRCRGKFN